MKGHINRVCDIPSSISEADYLSRTAQTDILVLEAWRITITIVIVVDQMSIRPTCVVTVLGTDQSLTAKLWFRNALRSGDCMNTSLTTSARLSFDFESQNKHSPSDKVGRATSHPMSGVTTVETPDILAT